MTLPWDDGHIRYNLELLAQLTEGKKLSVLKSGARPGIEMFEDIGRKGRSLRERFQIQSKLKAKFERKKKGESILIEAQYRIPLSMLFAHASSNYQNRLNGITKRHLHRAYAGLQQLALTYHSNIPKRNEMAIILQSTGTNLPDLNGIELKASRRFDMLNMREFHGLKNDVYSILNYNDNDSTKNEQDAKSLQQRTIYGIAGASRAIPTIIPTLPSEPYRRRKLGICIQAVMDWGRAGDTIDTLSLNDRFIHYGDLAIKDLYTAFNNDEAMLFIVSQLISQSGLPALPNIILTYKSAAKLTQRLNKPMFYIGAKRIIPTGFNVMTSIVTDGRVVTVTSEGAQNPAMPMMVTALQNKKFRLSDRTIVIEPETMRDLGIAELSLKFSMRLEREEGRIKWRLTTADMIFRKT